MIYIYNLENYMHGHTIRQGGKFQGNKMGLVLYS